MFLSRYVCFMVVVAWLGPDKTNVKAFLPSSTSANSRSTQLMMETAPVGNAGQSLPPPTKMSKRVRILNKLGFNQLARDQAERREAAAATKKPKIKYTVTDNDALDAYFRDDDRKFRDEKGEIDYGTLLSSLNVQGDTQMIGSKEDLDYVHPVAQLLHERRRNQSMPMEGPRPDGYRLALSIEGGGMRGCVSAGMVGAVHYLNLTDTFDIFYGSSAGSIIGSYLLTGQLPWFGPELYYDQLTTAGRSFINTRRLLRALGLGLLDPRLYKDVITRRGGGKPVLSLPFLVNRTLQHTKALDWNTFKEKQKTQPLKVLTSGLKSEKAVIMSMENGNFKTLAELGSCMHASCLLPGLAGAVMNINRTAVALDQGQKMILGNNLNHDDLEPLADSLLFQPMPFRVAIEEGATHVVTIRSRPDGTDVSGKGSFFEKLILRRFLLRKNKLANIYKFMTRGYHKRVYSEDVLTLNKYANSRRDYKDLSEPHVLTVALPPGSEEVEKLETERETIFAGVRRGFARAYDALVEDPAERGRGAEVAKVVFPDEILDYDPLAYGVSEKSAFELYLKESGKEVPNIWRASQ